MKTDKPREFWIVQKCNNEGQIRTISAYSHEPVALYDNHDTKVTQVIEHSAYAALEARLNKAERVIAFYAANENWLTSKTESLAEHFGDLITVKDLEEDSPITKRKFVGGKLARQTLKELGEK
jgi:hypothetical protein